MPRRIKSAKIKFISLVPKGANQIPVLYKEDGTFNLAPMVKADMELGEIHACVYAPEMVDSQGDLADAAAIKEMCHSFGKEGEGVDFRHNEKVLSKDKIFVAESTIIQKGDPRFSDFTDKNGKKIDVTGGWGVVLKVEDETLRKMYREGEWEGVSMGGIGTFSTEKTDEDSIIDRIARRVKKLMGVDDKEIDMTPEELAKLLADNNEALIKGIVEGISKATVNKSDDEGTEPDEDVTKTEEPKAPVFKGDITNADDVRKHRKAIALWQLEKEYDLSDPGQFAEYAQKAAEINEEYAEDTTELDSKAGVEKEDDEEVRSLKRKLHKAQQRSNAGKSEVNKDADSVTEIDGISKEDSELLAAGASSVREFYGEKED